MMTCTDILNYGRYAWFAKFGVALSGAIVVIFSFAPQIVQGQKVDSLESLLEKEFGPRRQHILYELAYHFTDNDNLLAMSYTNQAAKLNDTIGDSLMIVKCGRLKSLLYRRFDEMDSSLLLSSKILPIAERNKFDDEIKKILNGLAIVYTYKSSYDKALTCYKRILDESDPEKNKGEASVTFNNLGLTYFKLEDFEKALFYFEKALIFKREVRDTFDLDKALVNISSCYAYLKNYPAAKEYNDMALMACKTKCSKAMVIRVEGNLGLISNGLKQFAESKRHFEKSYKLALEIKDSRLQIDLLTQLFQLYNDTHDMQSARILLPDAERVLSANSFYIFGIIQLCKQLTRVYEKTGDVYKLAYYQGKYIQLKESVYNEKLTNNLMRVEAEFQERENVAKLEAQARILELSNDIIDRQRALSTVVAIVAILLLAVVILLMQNISQRKRITSLLEQKVKERTLELQNKHDLLIKSMQERDIQVQRMSNEIRSSLATIKGLGVLAMHDLVAGNTSNYLAKIEETSNILIQGLRRVHDQQF